MVQTIPILTIDGPSGSGKGTISRKLASELNWHMLDSGAIYRSLALYVMSDGCALNRVERIIELAQGLPVEFIGERVLLDGRDVSQEIRGEGCGDMASQLAVVGEVREALLQRQRDFAQEPGLVADGRDMGTVVFPSAFLKIYLDASVEERAKRRFLQLKVSGFDVNLHDLVGEIIQRDVRDRTRAVAPLQPAEDAIILDTSGMGVEEVFVRVLEQVDLRLMG